MKTAGLRTPKNVKQLRNGTVVLKSAAPGGMRKLRCPNCNGTATPAHNAQGKPVSRCGTCTREFTLTRM